MRRSTFVAAIGAALGLASAVWAATYEYDALGRLVAVTHDDGATAEYSYDPNGNRTQVTAINAAGDPPAPSAVIVVPLNGFTVIPLQ